MSCDCDDLGSVAARVIGAAEALKGQRQVKVVIGPVESAVYVAHGDKMCIPKGDLFEFIHNVGILDITTSVVLEFLRGRFSDTDLSEAVLSIQRFISVVKTKWRDAKRNKNVFKKNNSEWLKQDLCLSSSVCCARAPAQVYKTRPFR